MPLDRANIFSYVTFSWMGEYIRKAYKSGLQPEDIPLCSTRDGCDHCGQRYNTNDKLICVTQLIPSRL